MNVREKIENGAYDHKGAFTTREKRAKYRAEQAEMEKQFRADLEAEYGLYLDIEV